MGLLSAGGLLSSRDAGRGQGDVQDEGGVAAQDLVEGLEMRRGVRTYGLEDAERLFGVWMSSAGLGLSGKTDLVLRGVDRVAVVDFKLTSGEVGENQRMQLAGYSLLAEEAFAMPVPVAFIYRIPDNRLFPVEITDELRGAVRRAVVAIREMAEQQICPPATEVRGRCAECEYANYCGDVW